MKRLLFLCLITSIYYTGCAHIERTEALLYAHETRQIHLRLEEDALKKCNYDFEKRPGYWPVDKMDEPGVRAALKGRIIIYYPKNDTPAVAHEYSHFLDHNGKDGRRVSWECLSEVKADLIDQVIQMRREILTHKRIIMDAKFKRRIGNR